MKKSVLSFWILIGFLLACQTNSFASPNEPFCILKGTLLQGVQNECYIYKDTCKNIEGRFAGCAPFFIVYPDSRVDELGATKLIEDMGMASYLHDYSATICVVNAVGKKYESAADFDAFKALLNRFRVYSNLKVVGIGSGATFINSTIAHHAGAVAGILTIGGKAAKSAKSDSPVPTFVAGKTASAVAKTYIECNKALKTSSKGGLTVYENNADALQRVVVSTKKYASLSDLFADAWQQLLSKNYRFNNYQHTWYTGAEFSQYGDYELEPYIMPEDLDMTRRVVVNNLLGTGDFLWYEYIPNKVLNETKSQSVPLLLLLHGNNNDPRTQAETSGFVELCAKENFFVAELEWQGNGFAAMGLDGIEQVVYHLLKTYPQLDPTRVYAEGLSAGAATATGLGIRKSHLFAAVGAQSAGLTPNRYMFGYNEEAIMNEATQKRGFVEMPYFSITGTKDEVVPFVNSDNYKTNAFFCAWQAYQTMNGMNVSENPDFTIDKTFGIDLVGRNSVTTNKRLSYETGDLLKQGVPMIRLVAVNDYGHWNFKPGAQMMWNYFKHFSRDVKTKKLIYKQ